MESPKTKTGPIFLPLRLDGNEAPFRLWLYDFPTEGRWAVAVTGEIGDGAPVPLRIESACMFGHVFHSAKCDCGYQLDEAFRTIQKKKRGVVVYGIDQDARGLGIQTHFEIYVLRQTQNLDTEEVYAKLDAPVDARSYDPVAIILRDLGVQNIALLSNNRGRVAFLEKNGFDVVKQPLEMALDAHNMATLMLEKEDLGYEWSFKTHKDWLEPIQARALESAERHVAAIVDDNTRLVTEVTSDAWQTAPALIAALADAPLAKPIVYLSDFPRVDDLDRYAEIGAKFVVVPFPIIPAWLDEAGAARGIKIQDWGRTNRYKTPRPQWNLVSREPGMDIYEREGRLRCVLLGDDATVRLEGLLAHYERAATAHPTVAPRVTRHASGAMSWLELEAGARDATPLFDAGYRARTVGAVTYLTETAAR